MSVEKNLSKRANNMCELCSSDSFLSAYTISPKETETVENSVLLCKVCRSQIEESVPVDENHFRCLNQAMWSEHWQVQVLTYRVLKNLLGNVMWANDLVDQMYLEDDHKALAEAGVSVTSNDSDAVNTKDSNGAKLENGDTVTLIKDLDVKGTTFTAKRGTVVKNISLTDNPLHVEGKINGTSIVLVAAFLKKA